MILIFTRRQEPSALRLAKRLEELGADYCLVLEEDVYEKKGTLLQISQKQISVFGIPTNTIQSVFFRKWNAYAINNRLKHTAENSHAISEYQFVFDFVGQLPHARKLGFYNMAMNNKLYQQYIAQQVGLAVLQNVVCNRQLPVLEGQWVSKPLNRAFSNATAYGNHTTIPLPRQLPHDFGLAYLQPLVNKQFEVRALFLDGSCYAIAYYTAKNTNTDRRYQTGKHTVVPFRLPLVIEEKLTLFMQLLGGNYALLDLIYNENADLFYFLEANPFGQYGDLIKYGGYDIDGAIVNYLMQEDDHKKVQLETAQSGTYKNANSRANKGNGKEATSNQ